MTIGTDVDVARLEGTVSRDAALVDELTALVNGVYADAERGLWREGTTRTSTSELAELIAAGQIAVARDRDGRIVGSVHLRGISVVHERDDETKIEVVSGGRKWTPFRTWPVA